MASPPRQSPRAAIRDWLAHANAGSISKPKRRSDHQWKGSKIDIENPQTPRHPHLPSEGSEQVRRPPCVEKDGQITQDYLRHQAGQKSQDYPSGASTGRTLAGQPGSNARFLPFTSHGIDVIPEMKRNRERRRRRRSPSVTSSDLEPATCFQKNHNGSEVQRGTETDTDRNRIQEEHATISSRSSDATILSPTKPAKSYERRSRRKTREDRYELKQDRKRKKPEDTEKGTDHKPRKKRKRTERSGAMVMHKFSANNVEPKRLTLKGATALGLFGKGRASSPVRRRGLPDLTFNEMNFLNHRKAAPDEKHGPQGKKSRQKNDRAADAEAEISRFFASSKDQCRPGEGNGKHRASKRRMNEEMGTGHEQQRSSLPPVELPEKPFLGFGSCGPGHVSSLSSVSNVHSGRLPPHKPTSNRSTIYYTWSPSQQSRRSPSIVPSQSPPLLNESHQKLHSKVDSSAGRNERNVRKQRRASPATKDNNKEGHAGIGRAPSNSSGASQLFSQASAEEDRRETKGQKDPEVRPKSSSTVDLPSLLALQNRPEVLGALLDALLGRVTNPKPGISPESRAARSRGRGKQFSVPEVIPEPPVMDNGNDMNAHDSYRIDLNDVYDIASSHRPYASQRSKSSHGSNFGALDRPFSRVSHERIRPQPVQQARTDSRQLNSKENPFENQIPKTVLTAPGTSNAYIGYQNIYQAQEDTLDRRQHGDPSLDHHFEGEGHRRYGQIGQLDNETSTYASLDIDDQNHSSYIRETFVSDPDIPVPVDYGAYQQTDEIDQDFGPTEDVFHTGRAMQQEAENVASYAPPGNFDSVDGRQYPKKHADTDHHFSPTCFWGTRYPSLATSPVIFSPWTSSKSPDPRISRLKISSRGNRADHESASRAPPSRFWTPNRLY